MNEGSGRRRLIAEVMDVRHDVVAQSALVLGRLLEVGVIEVRAQLRQGRVGNGEPQFLLAFHQGEPQTTPQADAPALTPQRLHRGRGVSSRERRDPAHTVAFARATSLFQSARNWSRPRSVSGCSNSFLRTSGGSVATSAPIMAASTTCRGWRIDAAKISVSML